LAGGEEQAADEHEGVLPDAAAEAWRAWGDQV
jgi:hypothetical protein